MEEPDYILEHAAAIQAYVSKRLSILPNEFEEVFREAERLRRERFEWEKRYLELKLAIYKGSPN